MNRKRLAFLADDLTGSMDTGVQLLKGGYDVGIPLADDEATNAGQHVDVTVVNTNTRNSAPEEAEIVVSSALQGLRNSERELIYKKIDSTFRGPIGTELRVIGGLTSRHVVVVPAIPSNGRVTAGGYHLVNGVPVSETIYAEESARSQGDSFLPSMLEAQCGLACGLIPLKAVVGGTRAISGALEALISQGITLIVGDATTDAHLRSLASAIRVHASSALACGSAGLMSHLFPAVGPTAPRGIHASAEPIVLLAGTTNSVAQAQVKLAVSKGLFEQIAVEVQRLVGDVTERRREIVRVTEAGKKAVGAGLDIAVTSGREVPFPQAEARAKRAAIAEAFGEIARNLLEEFSVGALVATGGDIALACCKTLGGTFLQITGEPVPLVVAGKLLGGIRPDLPIVTKAGGFGSEDAFVRLHQLIRGKEE
jgi:uncharacterized protein YgbK (DUF1537 family)